MLDPQRALELLAACEAPLIVGVRHHSPACAWALPQLLADFRPDALLIELPVELTSWIPWVAHPQTVMPVAMAGGQPGSEDFFFYPFADFSPELAAMRWARDAEVETQGIDRPLSAKEAKAERWQEQGDAAARLLAALCRGVGADDGEDLWDRMVEARAVGSTAESVRRAALSAGWAMRLDDLYGDGIAEEHLLRESFMRQKIQEQLAAGKRVAAVVGAFHASALLPEPLLYREPADDGPAIPEQVKTELQTALVPYAFELLDSRSGYPAGIRDPAWQQRWLEALPNERKVESLSAEITVEACHRLREKGHVAGLPDAKECLRLAVDLARLRGLAAPSRQELLEALTSTLAQGEVYGRGRAVAQVLDGLMVGRRRGRITSGAPVSGLLPHVKRLLSQLRLPLEQQAEPKRLRLDPLRSDLDRRRHVALSRLAACGIPYASEEAGLRAESLTSVWSVEWTVSTEAAVALNAVRGVTLEQAASGALLAEKRHLQETDALLPRARILLAQAMAECALPAQLQTNLDELGTALVEQASLAELVQAHELVQRIEQGHIPGCPRQGSPGQAAGALPIFEGELAQLERELLAAAIRACEGLFGSNSIADARALLALARLVAEPQRPQDDSARFRWTLRKIRAEGAPLMQGATTAILLAVELLDAQATGTDLSSWLDGPQDLEGKQELALRLRGFLALAGPLLESNPLLLDPLIRRVERLSDQRFLLLLPALRHGFDELSPAARGRLLEEIGDRLEALDTRGAEQLLHDPELLAIWSQADVAGQAAIRPYAVAPPAEPLDGIELPSGHAAPLDSAPMEAEETDAHAIEAADRWKLILGRQQRNLSGQSRRLGRALDELYGAGRGEGSVGDADGGGAGQEDTYPTAREWSEELRELFGSSVREEVLGRAVEAGRSDVLLSLDPEAVIPSIDLLEQVLSLKGALPEAHLPRLRRMVQRVIDQLVRELATRVRPALVGLTTQRPSRRPRGPLDLRRTINANLRTTRMDEEGSPQLVAERLIFKTRGRRSFDWRVVLLVDVSGSMEPSVIYSAMMSAILAGLPAVRVNFVTFSTEVIDLSDRADDPLGLLLEVSVGGGTHIAKALRYGRQLITVPNRTLLLLVSDFDEGWPIGEMLGEVREIVQSGVSALGLAALDDSGKARYNHCAAERVAAAGMPVAALTPLELARWVAEKIREGGK